MRKKGEKEKWVSFCYLKGLIDFRQTYPSKVTCVEVSFVARVACVECL